MTGRLVRDERSPSFDLRVTEGDIQTAIDHFYKTGRVCDSHGCAVSQALARQVNARTPLADAQSFRYTDIVKQRKYRSYTPLKLLRNVILPFDAFVTAVKDGASRRILTCLRAAIKPTSCHVQDFEIRVSGHAGQRKDASSRKRYAPKGGKRTVAMPSVLRLAGLRVGL